MRRSGSSSCLLRPKSEVDLTALPQMSVTLINTQALPTYSTERYYMLSELELKAHSTLFLCDYSHHDCNGTQDTVDSSEASHEETTTTNLPVSAILYLLWRLDETTSSVRTFVEETVTTAIKQCKSILASEGEQSFMNPDSFHLYLVVDIAADPRNITSNMNDGARRRFFQVKVDTAERLARYVAQSNEELRTALDGITVGITDHIRAAPGLEACLDAILIGSRDRRRNRGQEKSGIGIVTQSPEHLLGLQDDPDAAQGVLQSRTCAEWNGKGDLKTFARRAHKAWCAANGMSSSNEDEDRASKKRRTRRAAADPIENADLAMIFRALTEPIMTFMFLFLLGCIASRLWKMYLDSIAVEETDNR